MRVRLAVICVVLGSFLAACSPDEEAQNPAPEPEVETVEVTREVTEQVTVESTVVVPRGEETAGGGITREALPGPALPAEADVTRTVGETVTLDSGSRLTVLSVQSGVPSDETVYEARAGADFFVVEAEACVPESAAEPAYFSPREFNLLNEDEVRRLSSVPTKLPALRGTSVEPGECARGFITFQVEEEDEPRAVVYEGPSVVEWEIEEVSGASTGDSTGDGQ